MVLSTSRRGEVRAIAGGILLHSRAGDDSTSSRSDLALALLDRGKLLAEAGRPEEALTATREAVALYRRLAGERPTPPRRCRSGRGGSGNGSLKLVP